WHLIKLIEKRPARTPAFEEVREEVMERLRHQRREEAVQSLMTRIRKS
ncbi:MAG: hypothetical protein JWO94_3138, partial [Verrucomicrobiaceae bacterium]|nr:hypothetical protein [Verrucomicrobiaceae bacterium]